MNAVIEKLFGKKKPATLLEIEASLDLQGLTRGEQAADELDDDSHIELAAPKPVDYAQFP